MENRSHKLFKEIGRLILRERGYIDHEILEECAVQVNGKPYRIDLVGISWQGPHPSCSVTAIECGKTSHRKLEELRNEFDSVLLIDSTWASENFLRISKEANEKLERYENEINSLKAELRELTHPVPNIVGKKTEMLRIRCPKNLLGRFKVFVNEEHFITYSAGLEELLNEHTQKKLDIERSRVAVERPTQDSKG